MIYEDENGDLQYIEDWFIPRVCVLCGDIHNSGADMCKPCQELEIKKLYEIFEELDNKDTRS